MKKIKENQNRYGEDGITLITLLVMIIIIIILGGVTVSNILGEHDIIDVTVDVAQNYEITSYKEQIEQVMHSCIISYSAKGETPTLIDMADVLNEQDWVRSAVANTDTSISNGDIIVIVDKGYIFQVYYDSINGKIKIDYIGKVPEGGSGGAGDIINSLPTVKAIYEESTRSIVVEAKEQKNGIEKIQIIYKGQIIETRTNPKAQEKFDISKYGSGWYQVKAVANKTGAYRYAWVKVSNISNKLIMPTIALSPNQADGKNGWYKQAVNVTITAESEEVKEIRYRVVRNGITSEDEENLLYTESFTIDTNRNNKNICMDNRW